MKTNLILIPILCLLALFTGCANIDSNPNDFQLVVNETYGGIDHESELRIPHDVAADGASIRVFAQQGDVGEREDFQAVDSRAGSRIATKSNVSDEAELAIFEKEHLAYEVVLHSPQLANQEAIAIANTQLQAALNEQNTEQIKAWGEILGNLTQAALSAVSPVP